MPLRMTSTTWGHNTLATSELEGCDRAFEHELGCPMQGSMEGCTCYVSRIRLVKTPVGRLIPTTEPDLSTDVRFWYEEAKRLRRALIAVFGIAGVSALVNILFGLAVM